MLQLDYICQFLHDNKIPRCLNSEETQQNVLSSILASIIYLLFFLSPYFHTRNISIHRYLGCLVKTEIQILTNIRLSDWAKNIGQTLNKVFCPTYQGIKQKDSISATCIEQIRRQNHFELIPLIWYYVARRLITGLYTNNLQAV